MGMRDSIAHSANTPDPDTRIDNLGGLHVYKGMRQELGDCNFCKGERRYLHVYQISGQGLMIRLCNQCISSMAQQAKSLGAKL